jgi:hemophore-related protein
MFAGGLLGAASAAIVMPTAKAAPDQCTASGVTSTVGSVSESVSAYLNSHPQANQALTEISKQPQTEADQAYRAYFANNPQTADDLRELRRPVRDLDAQCGTQVSSTQVVDALQAL